MTRRGDTADRAGDRDRAGGRDHHIVADAAQKAFRRDPDFLRRAIAKDDAELVAREAAEAILRAHAPAQPLGDAADHLVGDIVAIGFVDAPQIVDRHQQKAAGRLRARGILQGLFELFGQMPAIDLAGERIEAREIGELLLVLVAIVDDADEAMRAQRLAVLVGEPAAGILDPELRRARAHAQRILDLIGDAAAAVGFLRMENRVEARLRIAGIEQIGKGAAGRDRPAIAQPEHGGCVVAPDQAIGFDPPFIGGFARRTQNFRAIEAVGRGIHLPCRQPGRRLAVHRSPHRARHLGRLRHHRPSNAPRSRRRGRRQTSQDGSPQL